MERRLHIISVAPPAVFYLTNLLVSPLADDRLYFRSSAAAITLIQLMML